MPLPNPSEELEDPSGETPVRCRWCGVRLELIDQLVGAPRWHHRLPKSAPFLRCRSWPYAFAEPEPWTPDANMTAVQDRPVSQLSQDPSSPE